MGRETYIPTTKTREYNVSIKPRYLVLNSRIRFTRHLHLVS